MKNYQFTLRGKVVLTGIMLGLLLICLYSLLYIVTYFSGVYEDGNSVIIETTEYLETIETTSFATTAESTEVASENTTESTNETSGLGETTSEGDTIYSVYDLEDLRQFKIVFYFDKNQSEIVFDEEVIEIIKNMHSLYPNEKISIVGHTNGYPYYKNNSEGLALSLHRAQFIEQKMIELGIEKTLLSVYNSGLESPIYTDYGNQYKNDRVEVYFTDHFIISDGSK